MTNVQTIVSIVASQQCVEITLTDGGKIIVRGEKLTTHTEDVHINYTLLEGATLAFRGPIEANNVLPLQIGIRDMYGTK